MTENLLKWMGGKHTLSPFLIERMYPHKTYVEVFSGALHVFFQKPIANENIVNDLNSNLINMYKVIKSETLRPKLIEELKDMFYSRDLFKYFQELYKSNEYYLLEPVYKAAIFIYLNRSSFNGQFQSFSSRDDSTFSPESINKITRSMFNKLNYGKTVVENKHFKDIIKEYDKEGAFLYLDPPYWITTQTMGKAYYEKIMTEQEHKELRDLLHSCISCKWMLSYDDVPEIRRMYEKSNCIISTPQLNQSSSNSNKDIQYKSELLIANYELRNINTLFYNDGN